MTTPVLAAEAFDASAFPAQNTPRKPPIPLPPTLKRYVDQGGRLGFGTFRPRQGQSGTWHWGVDIPANAGATDPVVAPERGSVVAVWKDNETPLFTGYGPAGVLLRGDSGFHHLLAHMDPLDWSISSIPTKGQVYEFGERIGATHPGRGAHIHWEVRVQPIDSPSTRAGNTIDPIAWLRGEIRTLRGAPGGMPWWLWLVVGVALARRR